MGMKPKNIVPPVPELPKTSVNPQPRNEASPVAPAKAIKAVERAGDDKILNKYVDPRSASIERQAIIKSVLESPMLAQLCVGKNEVESLALVTKLFEHSINLFYK